MKKIMTVLVSTFTFKKTHRLKCDFLRGFSGRFVLRILKFASLLFYMVIAHVVSLQKSGLAGKLSSEKVPATFNLGEMLLQKTNY